MKNIMDNNILTKEFDIFKIEYTKDDLNYIDDLVNYLRNNYKDITNFFNLKEFSKKVEIKFWNSKEEYRDYFNRIYKERGYNKEVPFWEVARSFSDKEPKIYLMSYKEIIKCKGHSKDTIDTLFKVIVHEFIHTCQFEYNNHTESLTWFSEALATNLSHQYEEYTLTLDTSLDNIIKGQASYINYYTMGKYLLENYPKEYILKLAKDNDLLIKDTPKIYKETLEYIRK